MIRAEFVEKIVKLKIIIIILMKLRHRKKNALFSLTPIFPKASVMINGRALMDGFKRETHLVASKNREDPS